MSSSKQKITMSSTPILITIPSFVNTSRRSPSVMSFKSDDSDGPPSETPRGKKRRLDHLSWEEKILRKKLKNRVAAQTSRDRKKAKMDEMENSLNLLTQQNETLISECQKLRELNEKILKENADLRKQMQQQQSCRKCLGVDCESAFSKPAVLIENPLQKGRTTQSASQQLLTLIACLLLPTSAALTTSLTLTSWKNSHKASSKTSLTMLTNILKEKIKNGDIVMPPKNMRLTEWWGRHQNTWNPVYGKA